jgi:hypothetical protein
MKVTLNKYNLEVKKETGDKNIYSESTFLHKIKKELIKQGYDVIKKRMAKDGHMFGSDTTQYIRSRDTKENRKMGGFYVYDGNYALKLSYEDYNMKGVMSFNVERNIFEVKATSVKTEMTEGVYQPTKEHKKVVLA